jgi:hypothetical protein
MDGLSGKLGALHSRAPHARWSAQSTACSPTARYALVLSCFPVETPMDLLRYSLMYRLVAILELLARSRGLNMAEWPRLPYGHRISHRLMSG